jgi:hypothetical protein
MVAKLNVIDKLSSCNYNTGAFVATDKRKFGCLVDVSIFSENED